MQHRETDVVIADAAMPLGGWPKVVARADADSAEGASDGKCCSDVLREVGPRAANAVGYCCRE